MRNDDLLAPRAAGSHCRPSSSKTLADFSLTPYAQPLEHLLLALLPK